MATKKSSSSRSKRTSTVRGKGRGKVEKVMHEFKEGELKSGGRKKVSNPKQAIAIALSEARRSGANIPAKGAAKKKATKKSSASHRSTAKKTTAKKASSRRSTARKSTSAKRSK